MLEEGESYALKGAASVPGVFWKTRGGGGNDGGAGNDGIG